MQVYIPPKQPFCLNPPVSYTIATQIKIVTRSGETEVPALALQALAEFLRTSAVIDGFKASVQIIGGKQVFLHFPRAVVSYGCNGVVVPIRLPQVGSQCDTLAEDLTQTFSRREGPEYASMLAKINLVLNDGIDHIDFTDFVVSNGA